MKKAIVFLGVLASVLCARATEDSYLYWMVGDEGEFSGQYAYARVAFTGTKTAGGDAVSGYLNIYNSAGTEFTYNDYSGVGASSIASYQETFSQSGAVGLGLYAKFSENVTYSSFVVELFNDANVFVAQSQALSYGSAQDYIALNGIGSPAKMVWAATSYAVPEPNSALMLLLGSAVLALRRRKQV